MHYEYSSTDKKKFSLHDCRATSVELTDKQLFFCFPDGIFFEGYHEIFHTGWIWQNHEPWSRECQMFIGTREEVVYKWDSPSDKKK